MTVSNGVPGSASGVTRCGHPELAGEVGAVAVVAIEELEHGDRLAELARARERRLVPHGVDEPDAAVGGEHVRRARHRLLDEPGEAVAPRSSQKRIVTRRAYASSPPARSQRVLDTPPTSPRGTPVSLVQR